MARTQKNKATANHLGVLKAKLAKLCRELIQPKGGGGGGGGFDVAKTRDARIGFVGESSSMRFLFKNIYNITGFPSVGKSTLLCNLAGVYSEVAAYEFTTLTTVPGVIRYKGAKIQVWLGFIIFKYSLSFFLPLSLSLPSLSFSFLSFSFPPSLPPSSLSCLIYQAS